MADLETLKINFTADTTSASSNLNRLDKSIDKTNKSSLAGSKTFAGLGSAVNRLVAPAIAAAAAFFSVKKVLDAMQSADLLAKTADRLKITTESLMGLTRSAEMFGATSQELQNSLTKLRKKIGDANSGLIESARLFKQLGLDAKELNKLSLEEQFLTVTDALNKLGTETARSSMRMRIFEEGGERLALMMNQGSVAIRKQIEEAKNLGLTLDRFDLAKIETANDAMSDVARATNIVATIFASAISPALVTISKEFTKVTGGADGAAEAGATLGEILVTAAGIAIGAWDGLRQLFFLVKGTIADISIAGIDLTNNFANGVKLMSDKWKAFTEFIEVAWNNKGDAIILLWKQIQLTALSAVQYIVREFAIQMGTVAEIVRAVDEDLANSMTRVIDGIQVNTEVAVQTLKKEIKAEKQAILDGNKELGAAWKNLTDTKDFKPILLMQDYRKEMVKTSKTAWVAFDLMVEASANGEVGILARLDAIRKRYKETTEAMEEAASRTADKSEEEAKGGKNKPLSLDEQLAGLGLTNIEAVKTRYSELLQADLDHNNNLMTQRAKYLDAMLTQEKNAQEQTRFMWESGWQGKAQIVSGILGNISNLMNSESRKQFEVGKAAAIADNTINTYLGATKAYQSMAGIPVVGPGLGAAAAAAVIASGIMNHKNIMKTKFGGTSSPSSSGSTSAAASGEATATGGESTTTIQRNISINMIGKSYDQLQVREMIGQINEQVGDNVNIGVA